MEDTADDTSISSLPIKIEGYGLGKNVSGLKVTTTEPGVTIRYFEVARPGSGGRWVGVTSGTFQANIQYTIAIYIVVNVGYYDDLEISDVTVNGNEDDYFINPWLDGSGKTEGDMRVLQYLPKLEDSSAVTLTGIKVTKAPNKTVYSVGEKFAPKGMEVTAYYSDGHTRVLSDAGDDKYIVASSEEYLVANETEVKIRYNDGSGEKTTTQPIIVNDTNLSLPITVKGFSYGSDASKVKVSTTEKGVKIKSYEINKKPLNSSTWNKVTSGTFEEDYQYTITIYMDANDGYLYQGLRIEDVTVNGDTADYFNKDYLGWESGPDVKTSVIKCDLRVMQHMPMIKKDKSITDVTLHTYQELKEGATEGPAITRSGLNYEMNDNVT